MSPMSLFTALSVLFLAARARADPTVLYDGRAPLNYTGAALDSSTSPYNIFVVRGGGHLPSDYVSFLTTPAPTALWSPNSKDPIEQTVAVKVDNTSVFVPGDNVANSQFGFRRTEILAQNQNVTTIESGTTVFHLSVMRDTAQPLNRSHEYQFSFLEVPSGNHVFSMSTGTPFTIPATFPASADANNVRILDFNNNVIYSTPLPSDGSWTNLAVQVDWNALTLAVFASQGGLPLKAVTGIMPNEGVPSGTAGQGEFHFGVLKYPIADPKDGDNASNTPRFGIQEGSTDGLFFSGVFVEDATTGVSAGFNQVLSMTA